MAFGIYKPGQGYWVRVLTAAMIGILTLASAAWVWGQMSLLADTLPRTSWQLNLRNTEGQPAAGTEVTLLGAAPAGGAGTRPIGTARAIEYDQVNQLLRVRDVRMEQAEVDAAAAVAVRASGEAAAPFSATLAGRAVPEPMIDPLYLQGGAAAIVILIGAVLTYWLVGVKPQSAEFLIATDMEMKKVNWSTFKDIKASTMVVIGAAFLLAAVLFGIDAGLKTVAEAIGVLVTTTPGA